MPFLLQLYVSCFADKDVDTNMDKQLEDYMRDDSYIQGIKDCLPTLFGYISIGFAFGVVGVASGLHVLEVFLLS